MLRPDDSPGFSALLLANAIHAGMIKGILQSHGFDVLHLPKAPAASHLSNHRRFDLGIYDEGVRGALELANESSTLLHRVAIGLLAEGRSSSTEARLHFVMRKPLNSELVEKTVKAACAPIAADRRASFRHDANIKTVSSVLHHLGKSRQLQGAAIVNLSLTGLCIETNEMLPQHSKIEAVFPLPLLFETVHISGTVVWSHSSGRSGIKFMNVRPSEQRKLEDWADSLYSAKERF
jgi:PilZ domain